MPENPDITQNAFHLLNLSIRASRKEVAEAYHEAIADSRAGEDVLARARRVVLVSRTRLEAELSWFLAISPSQAQDILSKLEERNLADLQRTLDGLQGLDKANLAADLCVRSVGESKYVNALLDSYQDFSVGDVYHTIRGLRGVSGFPVPEQRLIASVLATRRMAHAKAAVACVTATSSPGRLLTETVETFFSHGDENTEQLLDLIVREYDKWSQPQLATIKKQIQAAIAESKADSNRIMTGQLVKMLADWGAISHPGQMLEESKEAEDLRSEEIYLIVREFCLWLASEDGHNQYKKALDILRALLNNFPNIPAFSAHLTRDVDALETLSELAKSAAVMQSLTAELEAIQKDASSLNDDLRAQGFGPNSCGLARKIYESFSDLVAVASGTEFADIPWSIVRDLAIDLSNKHQNPEGSFAIIEGLISHKRTTPSKVVIDAILDDRKILLRSLKWEQLRCVYNDVPKGLSLISELLNGADADERSALIELKLALLGKNARSRSRRRAWGWLAVAIIFIGILIVMLNAS